MQYALAVFLHGTAVFQRELTVHEVGLDLELPSNGRVAVQLDHHRVVVAADARLLLLPAEAAAKKVSGRTAKI